MNARFQWKISISFKKKYITEKPHGLLAIKLAQQKNIMWQEINPLWVGEGNSTKIFPAYLVIF